MFVIQAFPTHNRAGEITYRQIEGLKYEFTITTYTYTLSFADRAELTVDWGDNTSSSAPRISKIDIGDYYYHNTYITEHVFAGPGIYEIVVEDPNRNYGVLNIPNSVDIVFAIKTTLFINPLLGNNSTPILFNPPVDKAALHRIFIHNPGAFDPDGDSLSYKLATCLGNNGVEIANYVLPPYENSLYVDELTGDLIWDYPTQVGIYNIAMAIEEWRDSYKIGEIIRDMQIEVDSTDNNPPEIIPQDEICVLAGTLLQIDIVATDVDNDLIELSGIGGPIEFSEDSAFFIQTISQEGYASGSFTWQTKCKHVRKQSYQVIFKAKDNNNDLSLVDIKHINIKVIAPEPKNLQLEAYNNAIQLNWEQSICTEAVGYKIYRKFGASDFLPDSCITGVPEYTGFEEIANIVGIENTNFLDNDNGNGLKQGYIYCYRVISYFIDHAESYSSTEECTELVRGIPTITNVSVRNTDNSNGSIYLAWAKPIEYDTIPGNYKYNIYRSNDLWGENISFVETNIGLDDTIFIDTLLNTLENPYSYKVELIKDDTLIGAPQIASSVFLQISAADNALQLYFEKNTPWLDSIFIVFRQNSAFTFDSIGYTETLNFTDSNLKNDTNYCYKITSIGKYMIERITDPIINLSQINCEAPVDTVPPCMPPVNISSDCENLINSLEWNNPNTFCCDDALRYIIYYSPNLIEEMDSIAGINSIETTNFSHQLFADSATSMAGCYAVTAVDSFGNESHLITKYCVDECFDFELPNVFTPNGDETFDLFVSRYSFVDKVEMKIFNRWGVLVYETDNPKIEWDGKYLDTDKLVPDGVYFYTCDVYNTRLSGIEHRTLTGFVHLIGAKESHKTQ